MQNNMRDRLVELILQSDPIKERDLDDEWYDGEIEDIADHLLENGVIVPPCKVGDVVYEINRNGILEMEIAQIKITERYIMFDCIDVILDYEDFFYESDIGKTVFVTRDEAERALRERTSNR